MIAKNIRKITIIMSLIVHLLFLASYRTLSKIHLFKSKNLENKIDDKEKQIIFELVETPEDARNDRPPEATNLVSDKNSIARDRNPDTNKEAGLPYSKGDLDVKELDSDNFPSSALQQQLLAANDNEPYKNNDVRNKEESITEFYDNTKFSRQALLGRNSQNQSQLNRPKYDNEKFSADQIGGLSFNTYEWDFAPYMLEMKRKVERNVFPPPAFTHMGLISGETILRFKVMLNGEVKDLQILQSTGHKSLMETSVQAINVSSPFKPLPSDFPENYLEVTARFVYYIQRPSTH